MYLMLITQSLPNKKILPNKVIFENQSDPRGQAPTPPPLPPPLPPPPPPSPPTKVNQIPFK